MRSRLGGSRDKTFGRTDFQGFVRGRKFPRERTSDVVNSPDGHAASADRHAASADVRASSITSAAAITSDSLAAKSETSHVLISAEELQAAHLVEAAMAAAVAVVQAEAGADERAETEEWGDELGMIQPLRIL